MSKNSEALAFKAEGNTFFKNKSYEQAIEKYSQAIAIDPDTDVTFYSNRSACYAAIGKWQEAADDGRKCIMVDKKFVKGYFRAGLLNRIWVPTNRHLMLSSVVWASIPAMPT